jgi:polyhydroxyalkanoate synthase
VWCLDWGVAEDEDRYLSWDDVLARLGRAVRRVRRETGAAAIGLFGYCMGGTLTAIHAALHPDEICALATLAAPIDFAHAGILGTFVDPAWFDAAAIAGVGNVAAPQMQAGFTSMRPTLDLAKLVGLPDTLSDPRAKAAFLALEAWAGDHVPFPAEAYRRYITELYQHNQLVAGTHQVAGRVVDLGAITMPTLVITASRDTICPPAAATALLGHVGTADTEVVEITGGHVGAVVGRAAARTMYPAVIRWLTPRLAAGPRP